MNHENEQRQEANACIGLGLGVGALGLGSAAVTGAVCPLCYVVAPALLGLGLVKRSRLKSRHGEQKPEERAQQKR